MNDHECSFCHHIYSGQVCVNCSTQAPDIEQEKHVTAYIKNLKHNVVSAFTKRKPLRLYDNTIDDLKELHEIKEEMYKNMMNANVVEDILEQEKRLEEEKLLEQDKPTLKVFEIRVWQELPPEIGKVMPRQNLKDSFVMLSEDLESAREQIREEFGYGDLGYTVHVKEIKGPFKSGSILSSWDTK